MDSAVDSAQMVRRRLARSVAVLLFLLALLCMAWGIDSALRANTVGRNVRVQGIELGGLGPDELREATSSLTSSLRDEPVTITVADRSMSTDLVRLGVRVDHDRIVGDAFAARTGGSLLGGPFRWINSFRTPIELDLPYLVDSETIEAAVEGFIAPQLDGPQSPTVVLGQDQFVAALGSPGSVVDPAQLSERVVGLIGTDGPYSFSLTPYPETPTLSVDDVGRVAIELNAATSEPLQVRVLDQTTELTPDELRTIIDVENSDEGAFWQVSQSRTLDLIRDRFDRLGDESQQARFIVVQDRPEIVPAEQTLVCCDDKTAALMRAALLSRPSEPIVEDDEEDEVGEVGEPIRTVELLPIVTDGTKGVAELEALGITELVSTFTTKHPCCENRVVNIQLFADAVQGTVIEPGEVLSLNELVGQRTAEKGYLKAGAINLGSLEPQFGGGVSQAITTIFNAAFFAGLDFADYQAHSLYFNRYPEGREATISWPRPDLKLRNSTDYGVLIWTEYTGTTITVSMYSTKHIDVVDLPVQRRAQGQCRRVTTPRQRTFPDGRVLLDEVFAVYRPEQGLDCNGNPSDPTAVPPTTAPPVTAAPATPVPTTPVPTTPVPTIPSTTVTTPATEPPTSPPTPAPDQAQPPVDPTPDSVVDEGADGGGDPAG